MPERIRTLQALFAAAVVALAMACGGDREAEIPPGAVPVADSPTTTADEQLTGARAIDLVGRHIVATNAYPSIGQECLNVASHGQRADGWIVKAFDSCSLTDDKTHPVLGLWHIDSRTRVIRRLE